MTKSQNVPEEISTFPVDIPEAVPGMSWEELTTGAPMVAGADLASGELADALVGIPFVITHVRFQRGKTAKGMVTVFAQIAPEDILRKRRVNIDNMAFAPGDSIVLNDGSTGIYRQIVAFLASQGFITLPEGSEEGANGESVYDLPPAEWLAVHYGELGTPDAENEYVTYDAEIRLIALRGLRLSEYVNESGDAKTRYLA